MEKYIEKTKILIEALPYIQQFKKKTMVIKYGGSFMYDESIKQSIMDDIALMRLVGIRPIIVHGGGKDISSMLNDLDIQTEFVEGLRMTNEKVVAVAEMVLSGKINKDIVQLLENRDINAVGLSGKDGGMIKVEKKYVNNMDIGFVGNIVQVNSRIIHTLLKDDYLPIIAPIGTDKEGQSYNINADHVAYAIAKELKAEKLIYLTDTDGVYMNPDNQDSIIRRLSSDDVPKLIEEGIISGGMIPKVENSVDAIHEGVNSVHILDGKVEHSLLLELFTAAGVGTMIHGSIQ
jgi:acetylglutamate kinase